MSLGSPQDVIDTTADLVYRFVLALSEPSNNGLRKTSLSLVLDMSCLLRTFLEIRRMREAGQLHHSILSVLKDQADRVRQHVQYFQHNVMVRIAMKDKPEKCLTKKLTKGPPQTSQEPLEADESSYLTRRTEQWLLSINRLLPTARYLIENRSAIVGLGSERADLASCCVLEDLSSIPTPKVTSDLVIFEHIGLLSGGSKYNDRDFFTINVPSNFFRPGQVFMMLWDTASLDASVNIDVDNEPSIKASRDQRIFTDGDYRGPYFGPTTVRRFLVIESGARSSYCLPISTLQRQGCTWQPDQQNYGIAFTCEQVPLQLPGERGMVKPPIQLTFFPSDTSGLKVPYKLNTEHPSKLLPSEARIDYRRICEVEHGIRCKDAGFVIEEVMKNLLSRLEPVRARPDVDLPDFHADNMDLDTG